MSLSAKPRRVIRAGREERDVFVLGAETMSARPATALAAVRDAEEIIANARSEAAGLVAYARAEAADIIAAARQQAQSIETDAFDRGIEAGQQAAERELEALMALARSAAADGKAIRDALAEQSAGLVARAVMLATRRIVAGYYEADPMRTAEVCAEAIRAAAGQQVLSLRVNPALAGPLQVVLADVARYVVADDAVAIGGCIVDVQHGRVDATLDARLSLMELALASVGGEAQE